MIERRRHPLVIALIAMVGLLLGCASAGDVGQPTTSPAGADDMTPTARPTPTPEPDYRYNQLLGRDSIRPVYEPEFVPADQVQLADDELVLGIEIDGEAKAYPISVLNFREMVNDELAGVPILATW
jgi:hypothetical protein